MEKKFLFFFIVWIILGILYHIFYFFNKDTKLKRKLYPWTLFLSGILFILFLFWLGIHKWKSSYIAVPMMILSIIVIVILNIKFTKFCGSCGKMIYLPAFMIKIKYCPKCGAEL